MASRPVEKIERRLGEKLFLKAYRSSTPKSAMIRRPYPPGVHGKRQGKRRRALSEYGLLLREKQKVRYMYDLDDKDLKHYSQKAEREKGVFTESLIRLLETRLSNVVFRLGFAPSRRVARQLTSHGHILVNNKRVTIPSRQIRIGDTISIREQSLRSGLFADLDIRLKKYEPPKWLSLDKVKKLGKITNNPTPDDAQINVDLARIREFYLK